MTNVNQLRDDISFVRQAVEKQARPIPAEARLVYSFWAAYVLIGYCLIDVAPNAAGWFFMIGGFGGGLLCWGLGKLVTRKLGEVSRAETRRNMLHWAVGM